MKHISRIDQDEKLNHGWYVRIYYAGQTYSKFFSDKVGGRKPALAKAIRWRNKMLTWKSRQPPVKRDMDEVRLLYQEPRNQSTGVTGVTLTWKKMKSGNRWPYYQTTFFPEQNRAVSRAMSCEKYGWLEAFEQICDIRRQHMLDTFGDRFDEEKFNRDMQAHIEKMGLRRAQAEVV